MSMKKKSGIALGAFLTLAFTGAVKAEVGMMEPNISHHDRESIRKGAELFADYCVGCHSVEYLRYQRLADDVGQDEDWVEEKIMRGNFELHEPIISPMDPEDGENWFGLTPPDLSLTSRVEGDDWIYTYLNTFYVDEDAEVGYNNYVQEGTSMPHILFALQGDQKAVRDDDGNIVDFEIIEGAEGKLSEEEYREVTAQLTAFLSYAGEPIRADRERMGVWVILFLIVMTGVFYLLYKEFWRDIKK
ncbi:MAG: cytochrome c1 [Halorhodospira halophila]|uniref:cytochrome c1 n=2 Tax=Ectothiorhodospiraceae TaxID=72276 RepID=UPI00191456E8|nr:MULTISPECIES: cytochrome c1 [Halorhodospira]MBK5944420.1 hypothetical protein [Halorhodospira halophila]MCC3750547.1 cytochrome c1 [Halorhodospira halophila]MCG5527459.1 cytochrome c1 [Halorhodospira halophila]MCG5543547.1 cytochrome c1 [Halorhodospira sp. 9628]